MQETRCETTLQAPPERIWELLSDLNLYAEWNPLFVRAEGALQQGGELGLTVQLPSIPPFVITPRVLAAHSQSGFQWRHAMATSVLMSWTYGISLAEQGPQGVTVVQSSRFGGLLGPLFGFALATSVERGMKEFSRALARWGEKGNVRCLRC
ncbi:cyclase [Geomonas sp. Red276]